MARPRTEAPGAWPIAATTQETELGPRHCLADGAILEASPERAGWCPRAQAFAVAFRVLLTGLDGQQAEVVRETRCPARCRVCRERLTWDGGCNACHGSWTPDDRTSWTFPGDRYEASADGHYALLARGPRPCVAEAELAQVVAAVRAAVPRVGDVGVWAECEGARPVRRRMPTEEPAP